MDSTHTPCVTSALRWLPTLRFVSSEYHIRELYRRCWWVKMYIVHIVFSDRNFIVPLLHPNILLIEKHPFVYRYRRLPSGYTPHPFYSSYPYLFDFVGIYIYFTQHRKQQRADIYHWYWRFKGYYICRGYIYIYKYIN